MESAGENVTAIEVPGEDAAIGLALEELDGKIDAFSTAMQAGLDALRHAADRARQDQRAKAPATSAPPQAVEPAAATAAVAAGSSPAASEPAAAAKPAAKIPVARAVVKPAGPEVVKFRPKGAEPAAPAEVDEDEALLATLDPKLAKAIRVKRRLCNNKKSVRELLEEQRR